MDWEGVLTGVRGLVRQISCGQVNVVNGGSGSPGPLVSIPGVYTGYVRAFLVSSPVLRELNEYLPVYRSPASSSTST